VAVPIALYHGGRELSTKVPATVSETDQLASICVACSKYPDYILALIT
jgi:hypothetical protein